MNEWLVVVSVTGLAVISPGPDFALVARSSLLISKRAGMMMAFGIGAGVLVHVTYTLLGVGLLIQKSPALFDAMKFAGSAYLVWLGMKMLRTRPEKHAIYKPNVDMSDFGAFRVGFLTNAMNPKTTIFIVSLFMQVVNSTTTIDIQIYYGIFISLAHVTWFMIVCIFFTSPIMGDAIMGIRHWIDRVFGLVLVSFGVGLAMVNVVGN